MSVRYGYCRILTSHASIFGGKCPLCGRLIEDGVEHVCSNEPEGIELSNGARVAEKTNPAKRGTVRQSVPGDRSRVRVVWDGMRRPETVHVRSLIRIKKQQGA